MFGYVRPYGADLSEEEKKRYKAVYCGLCRMLNEKYGLTEDEIKAICELKPVYYTIVVEDITAGRNFRDK